MSAAGVAGGATETAGASVVVETDAEAQTAASSQSAVGARARRIVERQACTTTCSFGRRRDATVDSTRV